MNWIEEIVNRHIRIYVVFLIVLVFGLIARATCPIFSTKELSSWICKFWSDDFSWKEVLMHLFLISPFDSHFVDPPLWTLRIELRMIFVLPLLRWMIDRIPGWIVYLGTVVIGFFVSAFSYLNVFLLGMLLRQYFDKHSHVEFNKSSRTAFGVAGIILLDSQYIFTSLSVTVNDFVTTILTSIGAMLIFAILYMEKNPCTIFTLVAKIGDISYPFYLVHFILLLWFRFLIGLIGIFAYAVICFWGTVAISICLNYCDREMQPMLLGISQRMFTKIRAYCSEK